MRSFSQFLEYIAPDRKWAIRRGPVESDGAYFATIGSSTYYDQNSIDPNVFYYDISAVKIANTSKVQIAHAIYQKALEFATPQEKIEIQKLIAEPEPYITYMENDSLPLPKAAKALGYGGIKVWENDDWSDPSSIFIWDLAKVKKIGLVKDYQSEE